MAEKLKDMFFTRASLAALASAIERYYPQFDSRKFEARVFSPEFEGMELKAKMRHVTLCLRPALPEAYAQSLQILRKVAPHLKGFEAMCLPDFVELYGLEHWDLSLDALALFTRYASSEFAIRPYIKKDAERAMAFMLELADDEHENVRRFASEGCRPRLPWAMALPQFKKDPSPILPILEKLKDDESEFVRRSVANNLNDISKDNPALALDVAERWYGGGENVDWIVKHACRSLLKAGDRRAMLLFGFGDPELIGVPELKLDKTKCAIGDAVRFSYTLAVGAGRARRVRLEYAVTFAKAGGRTGRKVFKIGEKTYEPGRHALSRTHSFADMSTRKHYPGEHSIAIFVNGVQKAQASLELTK